MYSHSTPASKFTGLALYPAPTRRDPEILDGVAALGLVEPKDITFDKAVEVSLNGRFGLAAIGTVRWEQARHG
jgi:hypothetical protein